MLWFDIPDELLPPVYRSIKDMYSYARSVDSELRDFLATMYYIRNNFFVQTCDTPTLSEWISLLEIPLYGGETTEDKRNLVLLYLNNQKPATEPFFRSMLNELFGPDGYTMEIDASDPLRVNIDFARPDYMLIRQFGDWFVRMVPAHILWRLTMIAPSESVIASISRGMVASVAKCQASMSTGTVMLYLGSYGYNVETIEV